VGRAPMAASANIQRFIIDSCQRMGANTARDCTHPGYGDITGT